MRYIDQTLDDPAVIDGDTFFARLNTRVAPETLQPGEVQSAVNIRMDDMIATVRKGVSKVNDEITITGPPLVLPFSLSDSPVIQLAYSDGAYGSGIFSDPDNSNAEWVVVATADEAFLWKDGETSVSIAYPTGEICDDTDTVHVEQVGNKVYLFRGYDDTDVTDGTVVWDAITADEWAANTVYYQDEIVQSTANDYVLICTTGGTSDSSEPTWSAGTGKTDNTATWTAYPLAAWASTTAYDSAYNAAQPTFRTIDSAATIIRATTAGTSGSTEPDMKDRPVLSWDGNQANDFVVVSQKRPTAATHRALTAAPFAINYRNRLTKPTSRDTFNVSGILTPEDFDAAQNEFNINAGTDDYLIGFAPFQEDVLLVFYRKSVHMMTDFSGTLSNIAASEVIRGVGCAARKTIVSAGDNIYWFGDRGIYSLNIVDQLNLKGVEVPLSRDINDFIETINMDAIDTAHSIYFDNRLYFAFPVGTETRPTKLAVYNLLNQGWESIDEYPVYIDGFQVAGYDSKRRLIMINKESTIHVMEDNDTYDVFGIAGSTEETEQPISAELKTRRYHSGPDGISKWRQATFRTSFSGAGSISFTGYLIDPEATKQMGSESALATGTKLTRKLIGKRAHAIDILFSFTDGRPAVRSVAVERYSKYRTGDFE